MDPDAILGGEWGRSRDGCIRLGWRSSMGGTILGVNVGRCIVDKTSDSMQSMGSCKVFVSPEFQTKF